jgi:SOS response regulatory protein OraA/RecX
LGPFRLRYDLKRQGIRETIVDEVLEESFDAETQDSMAREVARRKTGDRRIDEKTARRISDHLRRKGFDYEIVNRVVLDLLRGSNLHEDEQEIE